MPAADRPADIPEVRAPRGTEITVKSRLDVARGHGLKLTMVGG